MRSAEHEMRRQLELKALKFFLLYFELEKTFQDHNAANAVLVCLLS